MLRFSQWFELCSELCVDKVKLLRVGGYICCLMKQWHHSMLGRLDTTRTYVTPNSRSLCLFLCSVHSHCASQRSWSCRTIPNKHGRRQDYGYWLQQNDVKM